MQIDMSRIMDLDYALTQRIRQTNQCGSYLSTSIIGCNTSRYDALLASPLSKPKPAQYVLLSNVQETARQFACEYKLSNICCSRENNSFGTKYIASVRNKPIAEIFYAMGANLLKKEILLAQKEEILLIRYTLVEAHNKITLKITPLLAFREKSELSRKNYKTNFVCQSIKNGIRCQLYKKFQPLYMQVSKQNFFFSMPDWKTGIEYCGEKQTTGQNPREDLFVPGNISLFLRPGESVVFAAALHEINPIELKRIFEKEQKQLTQQNKPAQQQKAMSP